MTPLYKKDDEFRKINHRPVTVLPTLNIIFERLLSGRCMNFTLGSYQTSQALIESFVVARPLCKG